ncbi:MAG: steroid delta-isomerase [Bradymonadia bacterium]|jgi:steroid delta-isomerase
MKDPQEVVDAYLAAVCACDVDAAMDLYSESPTVEDPVGNEVVAGRDAVRAFYERAFVMPMKATPTAPAGVANSAVAFPFRLTVGEPAIMEVDIVDVFHLDENGKIESMRAYWGRGM